MKESKFLGTLLSSHPDFLPIEQAIREKYGLPELSPDDDPITEVLLGDERIPHEEFRKGIKFRVREIAILLSYQFLRVIRGESFFSPVFPSCLTTQLLFLKNLFCLPKTTPKQPILSPFSADQFQENTRRKPIYLHI
jgi:hypothetical protein